MTDGMKSGAGDPFAGESPDGDPSEVSETTTEETSTTTAQTEDEDTTPHPDSDISDSSTAPSGDGLPYIYDRRGVKDDRKMIQYFLRDNTEALETEVKRTIERELGTDVYLTDIREALVRVGAKHTNEVADELRQWGYRYEENTD
jgi:hypothetical protein